MRAARGTAPRVIVHRSSESWLRRRSNGVHIKRELRRPSEANKPTSSSTAIRARRRGTRRRRLRGTPRPAPRSSTPIRDAVHHEHLHAACAGDVTTVRRMLEISARRQGRPGGDGSRPRRHQDLGQTFSTRTTRRKTKLRERRRQYADARGRKIASPPSSSVPSGVKGTARPADVRVVSCVDAAFRLRFEPRSAREAFELRRTPPPSPHQTRTRPRSVGRTVLENTPPRNGCSSLRPRLLRNVQDDILVDSRQETKRPASIPAVRIHGIHAPNANLLCHHPRMIPSPQSASSSNARVFFRAATATSRIGSSRAELSGRRFSVRCSSRPQPCVTTSRVTGVPSESPTSSARRAPALTLASFAISFAAAGSAPATHWRARWNDPESNRRWRRWRRTPGRFPASDWPPPRRQANDV